MKPILLQQGRIIDPQTATDRVADILIVGGVIEKIGSVAPPKGAECHALNGSIVAPGFCDMHVHLREPGYEYKETIETGTAAAAAGGFTAVCCMPNTLPAIDDASVVKSIIEKSKLSGGGIVDVFPVGAVTRGREGKELAPMLELAREGAVAFSDDGAPVADAGVMRRALEYAAMTGRPVIQHAEDPHLSAGGVMHEGAMSTKLGLAGIPGVAEEVMIARDLHLLGFCGGSYHVAHISTRASVALVRAAKAKGLRVTCEVTPHHFTLSDEAVASYDTNTKMNPPLRTPDDVEAMIEGLRDGTIDAIATDHAPHSFDDKEVEFQYAPFGIVGLETAVGLSITQLVAGKHLTWEGLIAKLSINPRKILSLPTVRIAVGEPANLTIIDPEAEWVVDPTTFKSRSKNTPFGGKKLKGRAMGIVNHGQIVMGGD